MKSHRDTVYTMYLHTCIHTHTQIWSEIGRYRAFELPESFCRLRLDENLLERVVHLLLCLGIAQNDDGVRGHRR